MRPSSECPGDGRFHDARRRHDLLRSRYESAARHTGRGLHRDAAGSPAAGGADALAALKDDLAAYKVSKGTIRFENADPVPVALIERIAKVRAAELAGLLPANASRAARR